MCPRIPDRITLRDSSGGWVPQLLVTSLSRRRHSFHCDCDCEHIRRVPPASISRHLRLGAPISVRQHPCPLNPHVGPMTCTWVRHLARGRRPRAYLGVGVRVMGLTRIVSGSRASDTPGAPLRSHRRPPCLQHPVVGVCYRGGLHCGRRRPEARPHHHQMGGIALHVDPCVTCLPMTAPPNGGNCTIRGATRRRHADGRLLMLQNPHHYPWCHAP